MGKKIVLAGLSLFLLAMVGPFTVFADPKLVWDASSGDVTGYRIYYGTNQQSLSENRDVGNVTEYPLYQMPLQEKETYFFVARAYNTAGESGDSNMVSWLVPDNTAPVPPQGVIVQ